MGGKFSGMILVTDLDGTFLGADGQVPERNLQALEKFQQEGGLFTISTGRMMIDLLRAVPNAEALCNAPLITCNGAMLFDIHNRKIIAEHPLNGEDVMELMRYVRTHFPQVGVRIATNRGALTDGVGAVIMRDIQHYREGEVRILPYEEWSQADASEKWYKLVIREEKAILDEVRDAVRTAFAGRFTFADSAPTFFELNAPDCSKAYAVRFLRHRYPGARIICCGDYGNDLSMLAAADLSVCPSNATDEVKREAHYCLCHHTEGLLGDLLELFES